MRQGNLQMIVSHSFCTIIVRNIFDRLLELPIESVEVVFTRQKWGLEEAPANQDHLYCL